MIFKNRVFYIFFDVAAIIAAFMLTLFLRQTVVMGQQPSEIWNRGLLILFTYFLVVLFYQVKKPLMKRSNWNELEVVCKLNFNMALALAMILYIFHVGTRFPRSFYFTYFISSTLFMYLARFSLKKAMLTYYKKMENRKRLILFANEENVLRMMRKYVTSYMYEYEPLAVIVVKGHLDKKNLEIQINRVVRVQNRTRLEIIRDGLEEFLMKEAIDEALISMPESRRSALHDLVGYLESLGITVHVTTNTFGWGSDEKVLEDFGIYHVLTYSPRIFEPTELFLKRLMDIAGGFVGAVLAVMLGIFVVPAIYLESPGPVIFKQIRIGRNGRRFSIYKFRSMYMDAEERKKELMAQNEMGDLMFKIKDDPRITKVGKFIRKTSIDEFPQFFNVLAGDMSLVGTRPPTEDEFMKYSDRHKRRLSLKPGITGMWQVKGRNKITDFEEIVNLDLEYIDNWSLWLDIKLLLQTVYVVLFQKGAS